MKEFLLFAGDEYYPSGGMLDLKGMFDSREEAQAYVDCREGDDAPVGCYQFDWYHIVRLSDMIDYLPKEFEANVDS